MPRRLKSIAAALVAVGVSFALVGLESAPAQSANVVKNIPVGESPLGVAVSPTQPLALATSHVAPSDQGYVSFIDTRTNQVTHTVDVGIQPFSIVFSPDGSLAYVGNLEGGTISVIDIAQHSVSRTITLTQGGPWQLAISPDGGTLYVVSDPDTPLYLTLIDVTNNDTETLVQITQNFGSGGGVAVTPDNRYAYVGVFDDIAHGNGSSVYVVRLSDNTVVQRITHPSFDEPGWMSVSPDGKHVFVPESAANGVTEISTASNTVSRVLTTGSVNPMQAAISANGLVMYVSNSGSNTVSVVSLANGSVAQTLSVGQEPVGVAVTPNGTAGYAAVQSTGNVAAINARIAQTPLNNCVVTPQRLPLRGVRRLTKKNCRTTALKTVTVRGARTRGDVRVFSIFRRRGATFIRTYGIRANVLARWSAPSTVGFAPYVKSKRYRLG